MDRDSGTEIVYTAGMKGPFRLRNDYTLALCCRPSPPDPIVGYFSYDNILKVHRPDCANLAKAEPERLVSLDWEDILEPDVPVSPCPDFNELDPIDFAVLTHHERFGVDYSLVVARNLNIPKPDAFKRHAKLRELGLLARVEPRIIQYRKGVVDSKWTKHRNHTYYDLTDRGRTCLSYWRDQKGKSL